MIDGEKSRNRKLCEDTRRKYCTQSLCIFLVEGKNEYAFSTKAMRQLLSLPLKVQQKAYPFSISEMKLINILIYQVLTLQCLHSKKICMNITLYEIFSKQILASLITCCTVE